ncbi:TLC domain-containing protein [Scenedesmus sp. NREL 46B-D3]|nr:TLC domain-containing protein [Scenedesmus sp. NREL 46B-D3]
MAGVWSEASEVLAAVTEDPLLQVAGTAGLFSAVGYTLLYKCSEILSPKLCHGYRRLKQNEKVDWNTRWPSTLHAVLVSVLCLWALCYSREFFDNNSSSSSSSSSVGGSNVVFHVSELSYAILGISGGYFLVDFCVICWHSQIGTREMYIHHVVSLLSLAIAAQVHSLHVYLLMVLLTETTTPFVNLRWALDRLQMKHVKLYHVNGLLLMLVWGVARVGMFVPFYLHVLQNLRFIVQEPPHAVAMLLGVPLLLLGLNTLWFVKIVKGAYKMMFGAKQQQKQQQQQQRQQQQSVMERQQLKEKQRQQLQVSADGRQEVLATVEIKAYSHHHAA